ncbi:MAG: hypothetical protein ABI442_09125 [Gemmatimonadaceae bacterium]
MTERHKPHNGRDLSGNYRAPEEDVDDILTEPAGSDILRNDVRHGGAVADTGMEAGTKAKEISNMINENREDVRKVSGKDSGGSSRGARR